jgi:hypothetical protein
MPKKKKPFEKIDEEIEDNLEIDENSDLPVHEHFAREGRIRKLGKGSHIKQM